MSFTVYGSHGSIEVSLNGKPLAFNDYSTNDPYSNLGITQFNVEEYAYWSGEPLKHGDRVDILLMGYWIKDYYERPAMGYHAGDWPLF
jgi:hypothetical protein